MSSKRTFLLFFFLVLFSFCLPLRAWAQYDDGTYPDDFYPDSGYPDADYPTATPTPVTPDGGYPDGIYPTATPTPVTPDGCYPTCGGQPDLIVSGVSHGPEPACVGHAITF